MTFRQSRRVKRIVVVVVIAVTLVIAGGGSFLFSYLDRLFTHVSLVPVSPSQGLFDGTRTEMEDRFANKRPTSFLLLGYAGGTHDGALLTDTLMVVNVNPAKKQITLISLPRDLWVKIPTTMLASTSWKINAAYVIGSRDKEFPHKDDYFKGPTGGGYLAGYVTQVVTGLPIERFGVIDFSGFQESIDALGGIDVAVEVPFDDYAYPITGKETDPCNQPQDALATMSALPSSQTAALFPCRYKHITYAVGVHHLTGEQALEYVRSRHADSPEGTDFSRAKRQQAVMQAIKHKVLRLDFLPRALTFIETVGNTFKTDLSPAELNFLLFQAPSFSDYSTRSIVLSTDNVLAASKSPDGQYILIPKAGPDKWDDIHQWLQTQL